MKTLLLATAAAAALFAAPALAQDAGVGSIGGTLGLSQVELMGDEATVETSAVDVAVATDIAGFTVTIDGAFNKPIDNDDNVDSSVGGRIHGSKAFGDFRAGAFFGSSEVLGDYMQSYGVEGQYYLSNVTVSGSVAYETVDDLDVEAVSFGGDVAYFVNPNFRVNGGLGFTNFDAGAGAETDGWQTDIGGELKFGDSPFSAFANFNHSELEDLDLSVNSFTFGVRLSFGGDLQTRDRKGGDLGRSVAGVGPVASLLN